MNIFRTVSHALVVSAVAFVATVGAVCPLFQNKAFDLLHKNSATIGGVIAADHVCAKDEYLKKAFMVTAANTAINKKPTAEQFGERLVIDYGIRRLSSAIALDAKRDALVKACDVLPEGMIRNNVNPVVEGAAAVVTHPEFLTALAVDYFVPAFIAVLKGNDSTKS